MFGMAKRKASNAATKNRPKSGVRRIVLHVGVHKTASTSLQDYFDIERNALLSKGALYIPMNRQRKEITPLIRSHAKRDRSILAGFFESSGSPTLLLSDENLVGSTEEIRKYGALYPFAQSWITRLCSDFPEIEFDVVLVLRSPVPYILSSYSEYIRLYPFCEFEEYIENFDIENFSFGNVFSWLWGLPRNTQISVIPFEKDLGGGVDEVAGKILRSACGPKHGIGMQRFPKKNLRSSFTKEEIELGKLISDKAGCVAAKKFFRMIDFDNHRFGEERFCPISSEVADGLMDRYRHDLSDIAKNIQSRARRN